MKLNPLKKERSTDQIESKLIKKIIANEFVEGSTLPSERELASQLGVGRPTVREVLQRLERDRWITCRSGMPATVNNFWKEGNLTTLVNIIENRASVADEFIQYLLELRVSLAPVYIREAVNANQAKVVALLADIEELTNSAAGYAAFDWELQKSLAGLSPNPVYLLILNSLDSIYLNMAERYFTVEDYRKMSHGYYIKLLDVALKGDVQQAEELVKVTMEKSLVLWKNRGKQ